ncbi:MAG TPA: sigma-70 family RNA polymerase sigma factor [Bacteroidota bacterium]
MSDSSIIEGFLKGRTQDYTLVVSWIKDVVHARVWVSGIEPDDIISDTTNKLLVNLRSKLFRFESSLKTYVQKIARFTLIDAVRRNRNAPAHIPKESLEPTDGTNPHEIAVENEEAMIFRRILGSIDEKCRELWKMVFQDCLNYKEIARRLAISENAVKTRVFRCKETGIKLMKKMV